VNAMPWPNAYAFGFYDEWHLVSNHLSMHANAFGGYFAFE
jgi:hypothetical protein